ncbi:MAG: serine protease, partial [Bdellovibrionales bacterium]|nr:serine protease [Bdellovibrionales bacterium]
NAKLDYALIRLDRAVESATPLKIRREGKVSNDEMMVTIGHPLGMPKMVADQIFVRDNSATFIFKTNADTFSGNSGSPVIGVTSGLVEGILIRGDDDFKLDVKEGCSRVTECANKECRGESVQRSSFLPLKYIPKL